MNCNRDGIFTPDMNAILALPPETAFKIIDSGPGDQIYTVSTEGLRQRNWLLTGDEIEIDGHIQLVEIGFRRARRIGQSNFAGLPSNRSGCYRVLLETSFCIC